MPLEDGTNAEKEDPEPPLGWTSKDDIKDCKVYGRACRFPIVFPPKISRKSSRMQDADHRVVGPVDAEAAEALCVGLYLCPGPGDCKTPHPNPLCDDPTCCNVVCNYDPSCCELEWDSECAVLALQNCAQSNNTSDFNCPCEGSCFEARDPENPRPGCEDITCCIAVCSARARLATLAGVLRAEAAQRRQWAALRQRAHASQPEPSDHVTTGNASGEREQALEALVTRVRFSANHADRFRGVVARARERKRIDDDEEMIENDCVIA